MTTAAASPTLDVRQLIELTAEVMFARMAKEHIDPLHDEINGLSKQVQRLTDATLGAGGNDPLQKQINDLDAKCSRERTRIWQRIEAIEKAPPETRESTKLRDRLAGAWIALTTAGAFVLGALEIWREVKK